MGQLINQLVPISVKMPSTIWWLIPNTVFITPYLISPSVLSHPCHPYLICHPFKLHHFTYLPIYIWISSLSLIYLFFYILVFFLFSLIVNSRHVLSYWYILDTHYSDSLDKYLMLIMILIYCNILIMANTLIGSANHDKNYVSTWSY